MLVIRRGHLPDKFDGCATEYESPPVLFRSGAVVSHAAATATGAGPSASGANSRTEPRNPAGPEPHAVAAVAVKSGRKFPSAKANIHRSGLRRHHQPAGG